MNIYTKFSEIMKFNAIITFFLFVIACSFNAAYSQNISNTLGSYGVFRIKDNTTVFAELNQTDGKLSLFGNLSIPVTTNSATGVIYKGYTRFIHDYAPNNSYGLNTFIGMNAGNFAMVSPIAYECSYNTGIGPQSLALLTTGYENTSIGYRSQFNTTTGFKNTSLGSVSLQNNTTGYQNTSIGSSSMYYNLNGYKNTSVGESSMYYNTGGYNNVAMGYRSLMDNLVGYNNTALGNVSLSNNVNGNSNTAIGYESLYLNDAGSENIAIGLSSLYGNTSGDGNIGIGVNALRLNNTGSYNIALGYSSLRNSTGSLNIAIGYQSLFSSTSASNNVAIGSFSLNNVTTGAYNTGIGVNALFTQTTGSQNTVIGHSTGSTITTGTNLTLIGYNSQPSSPTVSNQITLGNSSVTTLRCNVTTITSLSDARDKKNIKELSLGLDFITKLQPRQFYWDKREWYDDNVSDGSKMQQLPTAGFIAQELDSLQSSENAEWLNLVMKDNPEKWEATTGNLLPVMVKAIQELKTKCDALESENKILLSENKKSEELKLQVEVLSGRLNELSKITEELKNSVYVNESKNLEVSNEIIK